LVTYCERWFRHRKEAVGLLTPESARRLHDAGQPYTVLLGDPQRPRRFIEVGGGFYGVSFLDDDLREYLVYTFDELEKDRLFLKEAIHRNFEKDSDEPGEVTIYRFSPGGRVQIERSENALGGTRTEGETDVSKNWEPKPVFGRYEALTREDR